MRRKNNRLRLGHGLDDVRVAAVDGQASPAVAQQLGVRGYPTIMWLHMATKEGDEQPTITIAPHNGRRRCADSAATAQEPTISSAPVTLAPGASWAGSQTIALA